MFGKYNVLQYMAVRAKIKRQNRYPLRNALDMETENRKLVDTVLHYEGFCD